MNVQEFQTCMAELSDFYEGHKYSSKVMGLIWNFMSVLSKGEFLAVIEELMGTNQRAPNAAQIKTAAMPRLRKAWDEQRAERIAALKTLCQSCGNSGFMQAQLRSDPSIDVAFRCSHCTVADILRLSLSIRRWEAGLSDKYILVPLRDTKVALERETDANEASVIANWLRRAKETPEAVKNFQRQGIFPDYVKAAFDKAGIAYEKHDVRDLSHSHLIAALPAYLKKYVPAAETDLDEVPF